MSILYLDKDDYLNETLISCCRNKTGKKIQLAKLGKRFFAVEKQATMSMTVFIKEYLLGNVPIPMKSIDDQPNRARNSFKRQVELRDKRDKGALHGLRLDLNNVPSQEVPQNPQEKPIRMRGHCQQARGVQKRLRVGNRQELPHQHQEQVLIWGL